MQAAYISEAEIAEVISNPSATPSTAPSLRSGLRLRAGLRTGLGVGNEWAGEEKVTSLKSKIIQLADRLKPREPPAAEQIREDYLAGMSQRQLEKKYFGFTGGSAYRQVKKALRELGSTGAGERGSMGAEEQGSKRERGISSAP